MSAEVLIVWPDPRWAGQLYSLLQRGDFGLGVRLLSSYPELRELERLLLPDGEPIRLLIVGLTDEQRGIALLQAAKDLQPQVGLIAASEAESTTGIRLAMRAGATDYWTPPFNATEIGNTLRQLAVAAPRQVEGALLTFMPGQPGDGASTTALHTCEAISSAIGRPALLMDCDVQCGTLGFRLGLRPEYSLLDAAGHVKTLDDLWNKITAPWSNMRLLTAPEGSFGLTGDHLDALPRIVESARRHFPFVVADMPAALYPACAEVLRVSATICLVCTPEITSLHLARRRLQDLDDLGVRREKVQLLVNRADSRNAPPVQEVEKATGMSVAWSLPNNYEAVNRAALDGRTVSRDTPFGEQVHRLAAGLAGYEADHPRTSAWRRILSFG
ncbi:MAG: hypothetical protein GC160_26430 [Acidobacteria bacterium]|nr:hypothetical protein [Acidobacteriota bacterium]